MKTKINKVPLITSAFIALFLSTSAFSAEFETDVLAVSHESSNGIAETKAYVIDQGSAKFVKDSNVTSLAEFTGLHQVENAQGAYLLRPANIEFTSATNDVIDQVTATYVNYSVKIADTADESIENGAQVIDLTELEVANLPAQVSI